jgi:hypothetical protein
MKLEKWSSIAQVVGGAAVVASLVVLIFEVRANTELARLEAYDAVTRDFDGARTALMNNPESFKMFFRFTNGDFPNPEEEPEAAMMFDFVVLNSLSMSERAFLSYEGGIIGEDEWPRLHRSECAQWAKLRENQHFFEAISRRLTGSYVAHLESNCDRVGSARTG